MGVFDPETRFNQCHGLRFFKDSLEWDFTPVFFSCILKVRTEPQDRRQPIKTFKKSVNRICPI